MSKNNGSTPANAESSGVHLQRVVELSTGLTGLHVAAGGLMLRDIAAPDAALSRIGAAIRWIRENPSKPLRVEALAEMAALSVSAFHRHFKAVTALSPIQYQKQVRLLHARTLLMAGEGTATSVAFDVGYESPNQFSRE